MTQDNWFTRIIRPLSTKAQVITSLDDITRLGKVIKSIDNYKNQFVTLDSENFRNFCSQQLNLDLNSRSDHRYIYSNILLRYNFDQKQSIYNYSVSELLLLAIAVNDQLAEKYHDVLFAEKNLSLVPLLVGGERYISEFAKRFSVLYSKLKDKTITVLNKKTIGFFSAIALRKEQGLLDTILVQKDDLTALKDLKLNLQNAENDPLYGILEMAALVENKVFIEKVLEFIERGKSSKNELLKRSFIILLDTAINQELALIVEYLCEKCTKNKNQEIYQAALSDDKIIKRINEQILGNIHRAEGERQKKQQKIYDTILQAALRVSNMEFVTKILNKIERNSQLLTDYEIASVSTDKDRKNLLQDSLSAILEHAEGRTFIEERMSAQKDGNIKKIYNEVLKNSKKALELTQKIGTTVSTEQNSTGSNSQGKSAMTNKRESSTTGIESKSRRSSTVSIPEGWFTQFGNSSVLSADKSKQHCNGSDSGSDSGLDTGSSENSADETASQNSLSRASYTTEVASSTQEKQNAGADTNGNNQELNTAQLNQDGENQSNEIKVKKSLYKQLKAIGKDGKYDDDAESGKTARMDLSRGGITINGVHIPADNIQKWFNEAKKSQSKNDDRKIAKSVFTQAFKYVKNTIPETEKPNDFIIQELITNYNQSGYWHFIHAQTLSIFCKAGLMPFSIDHKSSINCTNSNCVSIEFKLSGDITPDSDGGNKICKYNYLLKFNLKNEGKGVVYEDVKVSFNMPEKINGINLLPEIRKHFSDGRSMSSIAAIATFTLALTATTAVWVFCAIDPKTMSIKLAEAVGTYCLGGAVLIAACCLVVTAIIYCCTKPSHSLENNDIKKQDELPIGQARS